MPQSGIVVDPTMTAPDSSSRSVTGASRCGHTGSTPGAPEAHRHPDAREVLLDGDRYAVQRAERLPARPASLARARRRQRGLGVVGGQGVDGRLQQRDPRLHGVVNLDRGEAVPGIPGAQRNCGQVGEMVVAVRVHRSQVTDGWPEVKVSFG